MKFPKSNRLLKSKHFRAVSVARNSWKGEVLLINYRFSTWPVSKLGLTVPKKILPKAHDRNQFKRVVREAFRHGLFPRGVQMSVSPKRGSLDHRFADAQVDFKNFIIALQELNSSKISS